MLEQDTVQESITCDDHEALADADVSPGQPPAESLSTPSFAGGSAGQTPHSHILKNVRMSSEADGRVVRPIDLLADAKRYRKRAQAAESELEQLKSELAVREKAVADLTRAVAHERTARSLEAQLRDAGAIDLGAARALAERALAASDSATQSHVTEAVAELQRMRPWLFRSAASRKAESETGVMSAAGSSDRVSSRSAKIEHAAGEAIATGARTNLLRYLRLRRSRKQ